MKNRRKSARHSGQRVTGHSAATSRNAPAVTRSGTSRETFSLCSTATARFIPPIYTHTHTQDGRWDLIIAHPPCTYLTVSGNAWFNTEKYGKKAEKRWRDRLDGAVFFMRFVAADCPRIAVENPGGVMGTSYRKPDQIIQPYEFGEHARKSTCLWLKGLPPLFPTEIVDPGEIDETGHSAGASSTYAVDENGKILSWNDPRTAKARSKTFPGIAKAMADQWG